MNFPIKQYIYVNKKDFMMNITYINHSGFLVESADCYYLFDYFKGSLPILKTEKPILVFASHNHQDHYNPEVFKLLA